MSPRKRPTILPEEQEKLILAVQAAGDKKAERLVVLDVTGRETYTDYLVICHGTSDRHVQAIHDGITETLRKRQIRPMGVEGEQTGHWILIDYGGVVINVFYEPLRDFYDIEGLWAGSPVLEVEDLLSLLEAPAEKKPAKARTKTGAAAKPEAKPKIASRVKALAPAKAKPRVKKTDVEPEKPKARAVAKPKTTTTPRAPRRKKGE